jgi:hypothetical protein
LRDDHDAQKGARYGQPTDETGLLLELDSVVVVADTALPLTQKDWADGIGESLLWWKIVETRGGRGRGGGENMNKIKESA